MHDIYTEQHLIRKTTVVKALVKAVEFHNWGIGKDIKRYFDAGQLQHFSETLLVELEKLGWKYEGKY